MLWCHQTINSSIKLQHEVGRWGELRLSETDCLFKINQEVCAWLGMRAAFLSPASDIPVCPKGNLSTLQWSGLIHCQLVVGGLVWMSSACVMVISQFLSFLSAAAPQNLQNLSGRLWGVLRILLSQLFLSYQLPLSNLCCFFFFFFCLCCISLKCCEWCEDNWR